MIEPFYDLGMTDYQLKAIGLREASHKVIQKRLDFRWEQSVTGSPW